MKDSILITIDVEDWFQVENFKELVSFDSWSSFDLRVEANTHRLLEFLGTRKATFFCLGWLAERLPHLIREIHRSGHEVASHGYKHELCNKMTLKTLAQDITDSKKRLEDIIGSEITGYRAPSFSINDDILKLIGDVGYVYDSSYNSFAMHGRYGYLDLSGKKAQGIAVRLSENFYELPISNLRLGKRILPWGGGGYFRLIPSYLFRLGVKRILAQDKAYLFYMHPWEIDPDQPQMEQLSWSYKFRHYTNLDKTLSKLSNLTDMFTPDQFVTCQSYLDMMV